jgi:hypothetical protein
MTAEELATWIEGANAATAPGHGDLHEGDVLLAPTDGESSTEMV